MASVVKTMGYGGQQFAEKYLGWNRNTIRKGRKELDIGKDFVDHNHRCGRRKAEHYHPDLLIHIQAIVEPSGQT
ncbi:MAG: ISAzo13 family transposase, partial [Gammaproteobacteria bacterium]|nr:ISAzo13 family transposase [Gammaproteobacteria bacterium]